MIAPMLVPPTTSIGTPASSSARITPRWASPARAAAAEDKPAASAGDHPRQSRDVARPVSAQMVVVGYRPAR